MSEISDWLAQHASVATAIVWHGTDGRVAYPSWPERMHAELDDAFALAARGEDGGIADPPHNLAQLDDDATVQTIVSETYAWADRRSGQKCCA